tara:strand:- start:409 stop:657 length:249 start_codon:yes stop_codon:yes gene_type:complete
MNSEYIKQKLEDFFSKKDLLKVVDINGNGDHYSILVISNKFVNMSLIERHKIIYSIFDKEITKEIHAMQIKTYTHEEWNKNI